MLSAAASLAPMAAAAAFRELGVCAELADAAAALGWSAPTEIQKQAIPQTLAGACTHISLRSMRSLGGGGGGCRVLCRARARAARPLATRFVCRSLPSGACVCARAQARM